MVMKTIMTMREMEEEREKMTELEGDKVSESHSVVSNCLQPHGLFQARILEWIAFPFSRGSSQPWD